MRSDLDIPNQELGLNAIPMPKIKSRRPFWIGLFMGLVILPGAVIGILWGGLIILGMMFTDEFTCGGSPQNPSPPKSGSPSKSLPPRQ